MILAIKIFMTIFVVNAFICFVVQIFFGESYGANVIFKSIIAEYIYKFALLIILISLMVLLLILIIWVVLQIWKL